MHNLCSAEVKPYCQCAICVSDKEYKQLPELDFMKISVQFTCTVTVVTGDHLDYSQCFLDIVSMLSGDFQIVRILLVTLKSVYVIGSILR